MKRVTYHTVDLPLTRLHYAKCGRGPALIIFPATISEARDWLPLIRTLAKTCTVYFFELPGHKKSILKTDVFSTHMVALSVRHFVDKLNLREFSIFGFSFGGILILQSLEHLSHCLKRVILFAPVVTSDAVKLSRATKICIRIFIRFLHNDLAQNTLLLILHNSMGVHIVLWHMRVFAHVDIHRRLKHKLLSLPKTTLRVILTQIEELMTFQPKPPEDPYSTKCFMGFASRDQLLDSAITQSVLSKYFTNIEIKQFDLPSHQPNQKILINQVRKQHKEIVDILTC